MKFPKIAGALLVLLALQQEMSHVNGFHGQQWRFLSPALRPHDRTSTSQGLFLLSSGTDDFERDSEPNTAVFTSSRRSVLRQSRNALLLLSSWSTLCGTRQDIASAATAITPATNTLPKITQKVEMSVRISRPDGTFYIRGDETDDLVKHYKIKIGLFGNAAPNHVERFLSYVRPSEEMIRDDRPFPSYAQSQFKSFDQATGVLMGGTIPSLQLTEFAGSTALQYGGRILPAPLWLEKKAAGDTPDANNSNKETPPLAHSEKGLLIHRKLESQPVFGITTRSDPGSYISDLDRDYVAFGVVLEGDGTEFLNYCAELPTYAGERPTTQDDGAVEDAAKAVFDAQQTFFRGAAKSLGDTRIAKVYPGKLLRRVEVTKVSLL